MSKTPDQLTQEFYREKGYHIIKVEGWGMYPDLHRKDFLGIYDYLAFNDAGEMIAIQTTTLSHVSHRRKKMLGKQTFSWWTQGGRRSVLHGWYKKGGKWVVKEEELTLADWKEFQASREAEYDTVDKNSPLYRELFPNG